MENIQSSLDELRKTLAATRKVILGLEAEERLSQWRAVKFDDLETLLAEFGLPEELEASRDQYLSAPRQLLRRVEGIENELGNILIDVRRKAIKPQAAAVQAKNLELECQGLEPLLNDLKKHCQNLLDADTALRKLFSLTELTPHAKRIKKGKNQLIDAGVAFLRFLGKLPPLEGENTLDRILAKAVRCERKLKEIDYSGLPGLAVAILEHQALVGIKAIDQVKLFIEDFNRFPPGELKEVEALGKRIEGMREASIAQLLAALPKLAEETGDTLADLGRRAKSLKQLQFLPTFLAQIETLHATLHPTLTEEIKKQTATSGSPLNPAEFAAILTSDFFVGFKGIMLSLKMLFSSLGGRKSINAPELQKRTLEVLTGCTIFYGNTPSEVAKLKAYLEGQLAAYSRPFPFDLLFGFMKKAVDTYGKRLEKFILGYHVVNASMEAAAPGKKPVKMTLGRLVTKIEVWTEQFTVL